MFNYLNQCFIKIKYLLRELTNTSSKLKMILRRLGGGDEAYYTYVEEDDNEPNKNSALI